MTKTKNLKSTGIGKHWPIPGNEPMKATGPSDEIISGLKHQMVSIRQNNLSSRIFDMFDGEAFYIRLRGAKYEGRGVDNTMFGTDYPDPGPRFTAAVHNPKFEHSALLASHRKKARTFSKIQCRKLPTYRSKNQD
jgi:hypothetical protein